MYFWIWDHLPGNTATKATAAVIAGFVLAVLLMQFVAPHVAPLIFHNDPAV